MQILFFGSFLLLWFSFPSYSDVNLQNGGFFLKEVDLMHTSKSDLPLMRVYNSKTDFRGIFGEGWGTEYETTLKLTSHGTIKIHEYGCGAENEFTPIGAQFISILFKYQFITKLPQGYLRKFESGRTELFDSSGHLVKIDDGAKTVIQLVYSSSGSLIALRDNHSRSLEFKRGGQGLVRNVRTGSGKVLKYDYNSAGDLLSVMDSKEQKTNYQYSDLRLGRHLLQRVIYRDQSGLEISYWNEKENVRLVKELGGGTTKEYSYSLIGQDPNRQKVLVSVFYPGTEKPVRTEYEYFYKKSKQQKRWLFELKTRQLGQGQEEVRQFNECCGLPVLIQSNGNKISLEYDLKGRMTRRVAEGETVTIQYHPQAGKISKLDLTRADQRRSLQYEYDHQGKLVSATSSQGVLLRMIYDSRGALRRITEFLNGKKNRQTNLIYSQGGGLERYQDTFLGEMRMGRPTAQELEKIYQLRKEWSYYFDEVIFPSGERLNI